jgi:serine/threonine protein kinase
VASEEHIATSDDQHTAQTVQLSYGEPARVLLLKILRMTIVIWGLIPAAIFIIGIFIAVSCIFNGFGRQSLHGYQMILVGFTVPVIMLTIIRALSKSDLLLDRNGIEIPANLLSASQKPAYIAWTKVLKISCTYKSNWRDMTVVLFSEGATPVDIKLNRLSLDACEKLLVCLDVFAGHAQREGLDELLLLIKHDLRSQANQDMAALTRGDMLSQTELWEDELKRRFRAAAFMPLEPGLIMRNGSLTVLRQLALGGLSAVYLAQLSNNSLVVLKESVVPDSAKAELKEKAREMFAREARLLMKLSHPAVVPVLDYFVENNRSYLLLDYIAGQDLRQYVKQNGRVRESLVLNWGEQIAEIMRYLHEQDPPVVHRDLTPDNLVLRNDNTIVAIDFGAANEFISNATGTFVGKQSFIAPEQFRGKACLQSDIYAYGGTLYYLLTGEDPEALSQSEPRQKIELSDGLNELVKSCTELEVGDRMPSAAKIIENLKALTK